MAEFCVHCAQRPAERKGLCPACWANRSVRQRRLAILHGNPARMAELGRRSAGKSSDEPTDDDLDAACERMLSENPLWKPTAIHPSDPRYCRVVAEREAAGLPARHPGDPQPSLD